MPSLDMTPQLQRTRGLDLLRILSTEIACKLSKSH